MEPHERELLVARIASGSLRCRVADHRGREQSLLIKRPSRDRVYAAWEVYAQALAQAQVEGLYGEAELLGLLLSQGLWGSRQQELLDQLPDQIDELKLQLYRAAFRSDDRESLRKHLAVARGRLTELLAERHALDHISCHGAAAMARARYSLGASLYRPTTGTPVFQEDDFWDRPSVLLDNVMAFYAGARLEEPVYRELARTEPWRSLWATRKVESSLFGVAVCDHTEEQRSLVTWSQVYDNAHQHPECPADLVLEDDDLFDGWMVEQRRKRREQAPLDAGVANERIRNSQEVYLVAQTPADAHKVQGLNDAEARCVSRQRFEALARHGELNETEMPDTKARFRQELNARLARAGKG
jgi:hypothetical protein